MEQYILDSSVCIKWFFEEIGTEKALRFRTQLDHGKIQAIVPEFFFVEFANVCWMKVKKKICPIRQAVEILDKVLDLGFTVYSTRELSDVALENALRFNLSAYDGLYLALSEIYVAPFMTADKELFNRCKDRFDFIEYLGDIKV